MANRLKYESSLYLQQHAENPVDWFPWGTEAIEKAHREDKWIFLSIGYSSCHWCHVMERESFCDLETASFLNAHFVAVKVDREERPDIDAVYMEAVQMIAGHGGWPLNVWLTADLVPVYGGTYFPPADSAHRPAFRTVMQRLLDVKRTEPDMVSERASQMQESLERELYTALPPARLSDDVLDFAATSFAKYYDPIHGGFSSAPKFPQASGLQFLLAHGVTPGNEASGGMALHTLKNMLEGGIWDSLGGGIHRYSTDREWLVPHFEKMLYDQATMLSAMALAEGLYTDAGFSGAIDDMLDFLQRELRHSSGGYMAAIDADTNGEEGTFYVWNDKELDSLFSAEDRIILNQVFGTEPGGNWEGKHILTRKESLEDVAKERQMPVAELAERIQVLQTTLIEARKLRNRPETDPKILTSWNALLLRGLVHTYRWTSNSKSYTMAEELSVVLISAFNGKTLHRVRYDDTWNHPGFLDDYAFTAEALLEWAACSGNSEAYETGMHLLEIILDRFYDEKNDAFWFSETDHQQPLQRSRDVFDNAHPSASSGAVAAFLLAGRLSGEHRYIDIAERAAGRVSHMIREYGTSFGAVLQSIQTMQSNYGELVISGHDPSPYLEVWRNARKPHILPVWIPEPSKIPLSNGKTSISGKTTAYLCYHGVCTLPVTDLSQLIL